MNYAKKWKLYRNRNDCNRLRVSGMQGRTLLTLLSKQLKSAARKWEENNNNNKPPPQILITPSSSPALLFGAIFH